MRFGERRRLRGVVRELLAELGVRPPLDVADLCARLAVHRGRNLILEPTDTMPISAAYAMWVATEDTDHLYFQQRTSPLHRRHLILHEVGHIIAGHASDAVTPTAATPTAAQSEDAAERELDALVALMPDLPREMVAAALRRHAYDTLEEQQAEYIASTVLRWSADLEVLPVQPVQLPAAAQRALDDRRGWL